MYSVYECGCMATNVSSVSLCEAHNKHVISTFDTTIPDNKKIWRGDDITIVYNSELDSLNRMEDQSVAMICTYPNQTEFWARKNSDVINFQDMFYRHYYRLLKPKGLVLLFIEPDVIMPAVLSAHLHNFTVNSISAVKLNLDPLPKGYYTTEHKMALLLSKGDNDTTLGNFTFKSESRLFEALNIRGTILDTTCLVPKILLNAVRTNRVIGLCYEYEIFKQLVTSLRG